MVVSKFFIFTPTTWGNDSQFDDHIFHVGWFNHQLDVFLTWRYYHLLFCFNTSFGKADEDVALDDFCVGGFFHC